MKKVRIYTSPTCSGCLSAKFMLQRADIDYVELSASKHRRMLMDKGFFELPVVEVGNILLPLRNSSNLEAVRRETRDD